MNETFMKEKPVLPLLVSMALPNVISMLVNSLYNIVDSLFVARISEDAMTALSLVFPIQNFANAIAIGFGIGINAMIALYLGAGDRKKAETAATHGMALSLIHGILITILSIAIMPGFLRRFTTDESLVASGITYSTIVFLFATINMAALAFEKMFQAVGRMKVTMAALIFGCVCNILLDPILIFGLLGCPAMGAEQLEESEFEPMYQDLRGSLSGKPVGLFGSYGWGGGEWMDIWKRDNAGLNIVDTVICQDAPDDDALAACRAAADKLA